MGQRDEAALRGLVGAGPSRVGVAGAMRARDVSRPTDADLEAAVENLVVRRAWRNREPGDNAAPPFGAGSPASVPAAPPIPAEAAIAEIPIDEPEQRERPEQGEQPEQGELELSVEPRDAKPAPQLHHRKKPRHKKRR